MQHKCSFHISSLFKDYLKKIWFETQSTELRQVLLFNPRIDFTDFPLMCVVSIFHKEHRATGSKRSDGSHLSHNNFTVCSNTMPYLDSTNVRRHHHMTCYYLHLKTSLAINQCLGCEVSDPSGAK